MLWGTAILATACIGVGCGILFIDGDPRVLFRDGAKMPSAAAAARPAVKSHAADSQGAPAVTAFSASPFSTAAAAPPGQNGQPGPAEQLLDIPTLEQRWANDPHRDQKIQDVIAVTQMQDRITGLGETLPKLAPEQQRKTVITLINEMQAFVAKGVLPKSQVDSVASQLMAAIDPKNGQRNVRQPQ